MGTLRRRCGGMGLRTRRGDSILHGAEGKVIELLRSKWATGLEALG
jgi:hypothetical protein